MKSVFPQPPSDLPATDQRGFEQAWRELLADDLASAARDLEKLHRRHRSSAALDTAMGYLELRLGDRAKAEAQFSAALKREPSLAEANAGLVLIALASGQEEVAFQRLRRLAEDHPRHPLVGQYLAGLQLKLAETELQAARVLRDSRRYREAAEKYREALAIAPDAVGLYAEAAEVELAGGDPEAAASHAARAIELESENPDNYRLRGDALRAMGELEPAVEAYRRALALRPEDTGLAAALHETERELERVTPPPQYFDIAQADRITREQLAAVLFVNLRPSLDSIPQRVSVIATDIGESWAREFIRGVIAAGILDVFPNHTFQPEAFVRRVDLAVALAAALTALAPGKVAPEAQGTPVADVAPENLNYRSVALVVSQGLLATNGDGRFDPLRFVTGREAMDAVKALAARVVPQ